MLLLRLATTIISFLSLTTWAEANFANARSSCQTSPLGSAQNDIDHTHTPTHAYETNEALPNSEINNKKPIEIITFTAENTVRSQPLPACTKQSLDEFFATNKNIDVQFADRAQVEQISHPSDEMLETFQKLNSDRRVEAGLPAVAEDIESTRIVGLVNPPMHCLGLVLHSVTNVGIQVLKGNYDTGMSNPKRPFPGYPAVELTLLKTTFEATGPEFLVRLFNKIMQHKDKNTGQKKEALETIGFTRIWAEPATAMDGTCDSSSEDAKAKEGRVVFVNHARLESHIRVPRLLMRVLPMSKMRMEKRGSATLLNTIEKDMKPAMERFTDAYSEWIGCD